MTGPAYYNEIDPFAAQWLRNLITAGLIAPGDVDERSIEDVRPADLVGYRQCHFFAGIGIWSYALRSAGWSDDRPVWTGSCPCQPFSSAGKGAAFADERHLWPAFHHLIKECRPAIVLGEQVASKDADPWIDLVQTDLEALGYAVGAVPFPAAGVGAPHIRDRLYWVAHADDARLEGRERAGQRAGAQLATAERGCAVGGMADTDQHGRSATPVTRCVDAQHHAESCGKFGRWPGPVNGHWRDADWLFCRDGKWRPTQPGTFPLATGLPKGMGALSAEQRRLAGLAGLDGRSLARAKSYRVGTLRGYGNACNTEAAIAFIEAVKESIE